jgi:predicted ATPase
MTTGSFLKKIKIHFFKSIVEQEIELGLVNVLIGANGSGKSNILEAVGVLGAAASGRVDDESLQRRGVRPGVPRLYKSAFSQRIGPHISFDAYTGKASYSVSLNNPLEDPRPAWLYKTEQLRSNNRSTASRSPRVAKNPEQGIAALKIAELEESDPAVLLMDTLRNYSIYAPSTLMLRGLIPDPQSREPVGLGGGQLAEAVRHILRRRRTDTPERKQYNIFLDEAVDELLELIDWAKSIGVAGSVESILSSSIPRPRLVLRFQDRYMREGKNILTAHDASEGALYVLFCAVLALLPNTPKCLAIDNLDQALNPRLSQKLVSLLCKWITENPFPRQFLFTAHNPAVLDGLPLYDERIKLLAVDRNSQGHTVVRTIVVTDELRRLSEKNGWPLSRLWLMGHLGGVPNV